MGAKRAGLAATLAFASACSVLSGCAGAPKEQMDVADCMEPRKNKILWGLFEVSSKAFNEVCSDARFSAALVRTFEDARSDDRALVAFYTMMERYFQKSDEDRKKFDRVVVLAGIDPERVEKVSKMYAPAEAGFGTDDCRQEFSAQGKKVILRLECLKPEEKKPEVPPAPGGSPVPDSPKGPALSVS